jgi:CRISPR system Cascade subunit CasE
MHLTRFDINAARRAARNLLASPQRIHAAVLSGFPPGKEKAEDGRVLWRLDQNQHQVTLYIVSPHKPDLTHLVESVGWPSSQGWETRAYTPLLAALKEGDQWAFRLTANPTIYKRVNADSTKTQRLGHVTVSQQTNWLLSRTERYGFTVPLGVGDEPDVAIRRRGTTSFVRQGGTVTLRTAVFEGRLRVSDPETLRETLVRGIGPAKGYGCGLLTLAPMR